MAAEQGFEGEVYDTGSHWSVCLKSLGQCRTSQGFRIVCAWFCSLRVGSWQMFFEFPIRKIPNSPRQATSCDQAICLVWLCHRKRAMDMVPHPVPKVYSSQHVSDMIRYDLCQHVIHLPCRDSRFLFFLCVFVASRHACGTCLRITPQDKTWRFIEFAPELMEDFRFRS